MDPTKPLLESLAIGALFFLAPMAVGAQDPPAPVEKTTDAPCCHEGLDADPSAPLPMDRKSVLLREIARKILASEAPFLGEGRLAAVERKLERLDPATSAQERVQLLFDRGEELLALGRIEEAVEAFRAGADAAPEGDARARQQSLRHLGLAWLRLGEQRNCVSNHNEDSCLLPIAAAAVHRDRLGSENAIRCFEESLKKSRRDNGVVWLLNVAHMTLGTWPDGVPEQWRIPTKAFAPEFDLPRMHDVAAREGFTAKTRAGGAIMDDFDGDGRLDLLVSSMDPSIRLRLYLQQPDGKFVDVAVKAGLGGQLGGLQVFHFDANNDGRLDILVQRGAWLGRFGEVPNSLLIQQEDGTFVDRTKEAGIEIAAPSQAAAYGDVDNDGDLDLFLGYEDTNTSRYESRMFRNRGDGTFEDVTRASGVVNCGFVKGCAMGDYDGDRLPDLYVSTMNGDNHLFRNLGDCRFADVARKLGVNGPKDSFSSFFFDYDDDGDLDLWASGYPTGDRVASMAVFYKDGVVRCEVNCLYENDGKGGFVDATERVRLSRVAYPMGSSFGDVDNDGYPDLYLATGAPDFSTLFPNVMYRNGDDGAGGRVFQDVTIATDTGHLQKGHGVAFGDLDGDGDQDMFVKLGGALKDDAFRDALYENPGHGNHWLTVRLTGVKSNRFGVGARVKATIEEDGKSRSVCAFVGMNSSFGGNSLQEEMGLGKASRILELEVYWPTSDTTQRFTEVPLDRIVRVVEGEPPLRLEPKPETW
jgi:tetratricopeptide (TPR) repeat protein